MKKILANNKGITLMEVVVAMPLVAILLAGVLNLLSISVNSYQTSSGRMAAQQTALFAVDSMVRELQLAQAGSIKLTSATEIQFIEDSHTIIYNLDSDNRLMRKEDSAVAVPLTGDSIIPISISTLVFSPVNITGSYPLTLTNNIVSIQLTAAEITTRATPASYTINTMVAAI